MLLEKPVHTDIVKKGPTMLPRRNWLLTSTVLLAISTGVHSNAQSNTFPATGKVGIGTASPGQPMNVYDTSGATYSVETDSSAATPFLINQLGRTAWGFSGGGGNVMTLHPVQGAGGLNLNYGPSSVALSIVSSGFVGIGTTTPSSPQEVKGNITLTSGKRGSSVFQDGSTQNADWNGILSGGDYAESVDITGDRAAYEPGDVLVIDPNLKGRLMKAQTPYSHAVMGVYSTRPGVLGRRQQTDKSHMKDEVPMAMTGIVPTKVTAMNGAIRPGDLLVTSSEPGYAMTGTDRGEIPGPVVGKALGHLDSGAGVIEAVVTLQ